MENVSGEDGALRRLDRPINSFILHLDATFKHNHVNYPVISREISARGRCFHLVTLFVSSQQAEYQYLECVRALRGVFTGRTGKPFKSLSNFSKKLKSDYTLMHGLKIETLLQQLLPCCHNKSSSMKGFRVQVEP
ncbi:hypothetical protein PHMEG_00017639 [Phytophthora megakarya]|uniref:MULE transposase domain-containing protein n=1 Tax=Phytophthora megakarya TaxID=4795 RepID=A0A225VXK1_9STRA|nr:hypothetical protein PHMEG_00017639 [Phytophthora megakarya]